MVLKSPPPSLMGLPANVVHQITLVLPDPSSLASTCRTLSAVLGCDELLLAWFKEWMPASNISTKHRHLGHSLLHWRRLHSMSTLRLATLLLRLEQARSGPACVRATRAAQLLEGGDALAAIEALLPHSEHLLLQYAAQAGYTRLLGDLLAAMTASGDASTIQLQWDQDNHAKCLALLPAAHAAARSGQVEASRQLLAALKDTGECSRDRDQSELYLGLLKSAVYGGAASTVAALLQLCDGPTKERLAAERLLYAAAHHGPRAEPLVRMLLEIGTPANDFLACLEVHRHRQLHLMPLLWRTEDNDNPAAAVVANPAWMICSEPMAFISSGSAEDLDVVAQAVWQLRDHPGVGGAWNFVLTDIFAANSLAAAHAIWEPFISAADRMGLAEFVLDFLSTEPLPSRPELVRCLLEHALPSLAQKQEAVAECALMALQHGDLDLAAMLQAHAPALNTRGWEWRFAQLQGRLLQAVRRGDAGLVRADLQALGEDEIESDITEALCLAAFLSDPEEAASVLRALLPFTDQEVGLDSSVPMVVHSAHQGQLVRVLCAESPGNAASAIGAAADGRHWWEACGQGFMDLAFWLICHPQQRPDMLSSSHWVVNGNGHSSDFSCFGDQQDSQFQGVMELLHRLAAESVAAGGGSVSAEVNSAASAAVADLAAAAPAGGR